MRVTVTARLRPKIGVAVACYNRRATTLRGLQTLFASAEIAEVDLVTVLLDDGSTDGTPEAVVRSYPDVVVLRGQDLFWAASMRRCEAVLLEMANAQQIDYIFWFNDDTQLCPSALSDLIAVGGSTGSRIVVGATASTNGHEMTYSGMIRVGPHPLAYERVEPTGKPREVETFNGNAVLIPTQIARRIGGIDGGFSHSLADIDYGLRAGKLGVEIALAENYVGTCDRNTVQRHKKIIDEWRAHISIKGGGNMRSVMRFCRRHGRWNWPAFYVGSYLLWWVREGSQRWKNARSRR